MPLEYIESLPEGVLNDFIALNTLTPFTPEAQSYREGLIATLLYNSNISNKKDAKSVTDLFNYIDSDTPEWLEDERVKKARTILTSISCHSLDSKMYEENYKHITNKIQEEINIELSNNAPDMYVINKLKELINDKDL